MKLRALFTLLFVLLALQTFSQEKKYIYVYPDDTGYTNTGQNLVVFHNGGYQSALNKAKRENKLVFLDFYADWCGPCKQIEQQVFSNRAFADYVNKNFVTYKIRTDDLTDGGGSDLAEKMNVFDLPVLMVVNSNGDEVGRITGYKTANTYLLELKKLERFTSYKR